MQSLTSRSGLKFLLDENVKRRVGRFLESEGRVLVTNDSDFINPVEFSKEKVFSVVLVTIPQDKPEAFNPAFSRLLKKKSKPEDFEGLLIELKADDFEASKIPSSKFLKYK